MRIQRLIAPALLIVYLSVCASARGEDATSRPSVPAAFMRFVDDGHGGGALQTADMAFRNAAGVEVHLIAAVHIGEKSYYDQLNKDFKGYDAVLYELVKSKDAAPPGPGDAEKSQSAISEFQLFLKSALDLDFQLDDVDYQAPNFVHADMDKETFERMQEERGETFEQIMIKQILKSFNDPTTQPADEPTMQDMVKMFTRPDMERQIKVVIAKQMGQMDTTAMGLDGPGGSVILTERNKAALAVLSQTLATGKKKIAIFYGAAHMPDMAKHLQEQGFEPADCKWNMAWDLTIRPDQPSAVEKILDQLFSDN